MMEGGTLDFDDLMDTGDEFPGFEIAKFTPADDKDNNDDSILRTPEHEQVGSSEDFVLSDDKTDPVLKEADRQNAENMVQETTDNQTNEQEYEPFTTEGNNSPLHDDTKDRVQEFEADNNGVEVLKDKNSEENNGWIDNVDDSIEMAEVLEDAGKGGTQNDEKGVTEDDGKGVTEDDGKSVTEDDGKGVTEDDGKFGTEDDEKFGTKDDGKIGTEDDGKGVTEDDGKGVTEDDGNGVTEDDGKGVTEDDGKFGTEDDGKDVEMAADLEESKPVSTDVDEPPKKKRMYLMAPKSKMKMWSGSKKQTDNDSVIEDGDSKSSAKDAADDTAIQNGDADEAGDREKKDTSEEREDQDKHAPQEIPDEDDPHQQSFLSFFNLKPGMSKPKGGDEKLAADEQEKEFYSRKRLRTRKKVSYVYEDEANGDDDDYVEEDEEEEERDHFIDLTSPKKPRPRTNSRSPKNMSAGVTYAKALQNLLPGVDLSCLEKKTQLNILQSLKPKPTTTNVDMSLARKTTPIAPQAAAMGSPSSSIPVMGTGQYIKGLFECGLCGTFFSTASSFISHQETKHAEEKKAGRSAMETFRCEICNFVLTNRFAYLEHKKMKHNKSVNFTCNKCKVSFGQLSELQKHQQSCGSPSCMTCNAKFKTWVEVGEHRIKVHQAAMPLTRQWLSCVNKACQFKCLTQHEMKIHIKHKHMISELFSCNAPRCARIFSTREQLNEHKKEAHASEFIVQYQCVECKSCFSSKTLLAEHQYLHTMEKLRRCDLCLRSFTTFPELRRHRDVHVIKGTIRCQTCQRWCTDKTELSNHTCTIVRKNPNLRIYFCDVCQKDFRSDEKMFAHRKEHKNFYHCGTCFLECYSESDYIEHREIHGKYTCLECFEEVTKDAYEFHKEAHRYYVKLEDRVNDGKNEKVMFLCPNLLNMVKS